MSSSTAVTGAGRLGGGAAGGGSAGGGSGKSASSATPKPGGKKESIRRNVMLGLSALLVLGMGAAGYWMWSHRTPAPTAAPAVVAKFVGSDEFMSLPDTKQAAYLDALEKNRDAWRNLPEADRRAAWENLREVRENQMLDRYFAASPADRQKMLDEEIKRQEERRKEWEARRAQQPQNNGQRGPGGPRGGDQSVRAKARFENRSPERRAQSAQYRADIAARRAQLGLPGFGGGGGGRRG